MWLALALALSLQDSAIEKNVQALSHDDIEVREKATAELLQTPLDKLDLLAKHLKSADPETGARLRLILTKVLDRTLGTRTAKFELRPVADPAVQEDWVSAGADPKKPPKGYEARRYHPKAMDRGEDDSREWELVGPACVTHEDIKAAGVELGVTRGGPWNVNFQLEKAGAIRFDEVAAALYAKDPKGKLAILVDGLILSAPMVQASKFDGAGVICGRFSEADAKRLAKALRGESMEPLMRAVKERETADAPGKLAEFLRGMKGAEHLKIDVGESGLDISGLIDTGDLLLIWESLRERGYRLAPRK